eukprot:gene6215-6451_t
MPSDHKKRAAAAKVNLAAVVILLVVFPAGLTARQRALLHEVAESHGLGHISSGEGDARFIAIGNLTAPDQKVIAGSNDSNGMEGSSTSSTAQSWTDEVIAQLLYTHFHIDQPALLQAAERSSQKQQAKASSKQPTPRNGTSKAGAAPAAADADTYGLAAVKQYTSVGSFVGEMSKLLDLERQAEVERAQEATNICSTSTAQARGRTLLNLRVADAEGGLLGRSLLTLVPNKGFGSTPATALPAHKFGPHDVVALKPSAAALGGSPLCTGLVYRVRDTAIVVAMDEPPDEGLDQPLRLEKLANEVTFKRLQETLQHLSSSESCPNAEQQPGLMLVDVLFNKVPPKFAAALPAWKAVNSRLDESQKAAVNLALQAQDVALIHGPPGTGKTTAVLEVILQEVARGNRVMAAAASNIAVDNLVERLAAAAPKVKVVRVGHPARLLPQVIEKSLEAQVLRSDNSSLARECRRDMQQLNRQLLKLEHWKRAEKRQIRAELRQLAKEEKQRQQKAVQEVLDGAQVMCCTLSGALHPQLSGQVFDVVVIDEAAQAVEPACWSALLKGRKAILAGDHLQLPPTVLSDAAARGGLASTLFQRLQHSIGDAASCMLTVQYRMNAGIMEWSSQELYGGQLTAHQSVATHTLADLQSCNSSSAAADLSPLLLIDTAGCDFDEQQDEDDDSKYNQGEAQAAIAHVERLLAAGLSPMDVGIITPYSAQVSQLKELLPERLRGSLEISTVDGFQGREKEAIVISMVRSNSNGEVGFLADTRRMNVAVTRARRHVALVCDSETVKHNPFLSRLVLYVEQQGQYESAAELVQA